MHKIRCKIGKKNWDNFIKEIYRNYKGRFFTYDEQVYQNNNQIKEEKRIKRITYLMT